MLVADERGKYEVLYSALPDGLWGIVCASGRGESHGRGT